MGYIIETYMDYESNVFTFSTKKEAEAFLVELYRCGGEVANIWKGEKVNIKKVEVTTKYKITESNRKVT